MRQASTALRSGAGYGQQRACRIPAPSLGRRKRAPVGALFPGNVAGATESGSSRPAVFPTASRSAARDGSGNRAPANNVEGWVGSTTKTLYVEPILHATPGGPGRAAAVVLVSRLRRSGDGNGQQPACCVADNVMVPARGDGRTGGKVRAMFRQRRSGEGNGQQRASCVPATSLPRRKQAAAGELCPRNAARTTETGSGRRAWPGNVMVAARDGDGTGQRPQP